MFDLIQSELRQVINTWAEGGRINAIPLGHSVRVEKGREVPQSFRQRAAYDYCFWLIGAALEDQKKEQITWALFLMLADQAPKDLTLEERQAAESLAWKALNRGWQQALAGFPDEKHIALRREADA